MARVFVGLVIALAVVAASGGLLVSGEQATVETYPNGASADGLNLSVLSETHNQSLHDAGSYTADVASYSQFGNESDSRVSRANMTSTVNLSDRRFRSTVSSRFELPSHREQDTRSVHYDMYYANGTLYLKWNVTGETRYGSGSVPWSQARRMGARFSNLGIPSGMQKTFNFTQTNVSQPTNTTTHITYESSGEKRFEPDYVDDSATVGTAHNVTLTVSESGVVRSVSASIARSYGGHEMSSTHAQRIRALGNASVATPDWLDEAEDKTLPFSPGAASAGA
jgi:hypothetical protein